MNSKQLINKVKQDIGVVVAITRIDEILTKNGYTDHITKVAESVNGTCHRRFRFTDEHVDVVMQHVKENRVSSSYEPTELEIYSEAYKIRKRSPRHPVGYRNNDLTIPEWKIHSQG